MTDYEPPMCPSPTITRLQARLLDAYIREAIDEWPEETHADLHELRLDGRLKVTAVWTPTTVRGESVPDLDYEVSAPRADGSWVPIASLHWSRLWLTTEQFEEEMRVTLLLNGKGIPDDPSALGG
jgi:hypothetical protein